MRYICIFIFIIILIPACSHEESYNPAGTIFDPPVTETSTLVSFKQGNNPVCSWTSDRKIYKIAIIEGNFAATINNDSFNFETWEKVFSEKEIYSVSDYREQLSSPYTLGSEEGNPQTITFEKNASYTVYIVWNHLVIPKYSASSFVGNGSKFYLHF